MGVDAIIRIVVGLVFIAFFLPNLTTIIYFLGIFFGAVASMFNVFSYVGASCQLINSITWWIILFGLWFILLSFYKSFFAK